MKKIIFILLFIILNSSFLIHNCFSQWVQFSSGIGNNQIVMSLIASGNNLFAGTFYYQTGTGGLWRSTNNGQVWLQTSLNFSINTLASSENNIFAGSSYGVGVWLSTNNGQNWTQTGLLHETFSLAISGNSIFAGTFSNGIWRSTNNGQNWNQIALNDKSVHSIAISGNNPEDSGQVIFAGTYDYGVWLSTNNGQNWTQTTLNNQWVVSLAVSGNNIYAGTWGYPNPTGVWLSTNYGTNWTQTALNNKSVYALFISGNNIFAGTDGSGVYLSTNNGQNWTQKNEGLIYLYVRSLLIANNYIFAGTDGYSIWRRPLSDFTGIKNILMEVPASFSLEQNYPNPFNAVTSIKFKVTSEGDRSQKTGVRLRVFDLMGKEIRTLVNEELNPGIYEARFDAGDLPSGVYFYQLRADKFTETKKLIILK